MAITDLNCECGDTNTNLTLAQYRSRVAQRLGFAAVASNLPPGMSDLLTTFLQDAQNFLYLEYPALRTRRFFQWSLQESVRFYGLTDNDENWTADEVDIASDVLTFASGTAPAVGRQVYFSPSDELPAELTAYTRYYVIGTVGATCQLALTAGGAAITGITDTVDLVVNYSPASTCVFTIHPYANIEFVGVQDLNGTWLPMEAGIPPVWYTTVLQPGIPCRYEIRQCIEVFPGPDVDGYKFMIKGHFGLAALTADADKPTIDGDLVYLWALANAKAHYGQPDAEAIANQAKRHLSNLISGTHLTKRYVPGKVAIPPAVMPIFLPLQGAAP